jgi:LVIVD repeat
VRIADAHRVYVARTYAYVAAGSEGLVIVDATRPEALREVSTFNAEGKLRDSRDVIIASTNASLFAYVADGAGGLKVLQLTSPDSQPKFYGFSPEPKPQLIAFYPTAKPALSLSKGLERDRGVDETGNQIAVFGRRGSRPLDLHEMQRLFLDAEGKPWFVSDAAPKRTTAPLTTAAVGASR